MDFELVVVCMLGPNVTSLSYRWTNNVTTFPSYSRVGDTHHKAFQLTWSVIAGTLDVLTE